MGVDLAVLMGQMKRLALPPAWTQVNDELIFATPLEDDSGITLPLTLRGSTKLRYPDRNVMLQIEHVPPIGKPEPLSRLDWRPFHSHNNKNKGPEKYRFMLMDATHHHAFDLNYSAEAQRMIGKNLPIAIPFAHELSFAELLAELGGSAKILGAASIPIPPWEKVLI